MDAFIFAALAFAVLGYGAGYNRGWIAGADEMVGHIEVEPDPLHLADNIHLLRNAA